LVRSEIYIACGVGLKLKVKVIIAMHFGLIGTVAFFCIFGSLRCLNNYVASEKNADAMALRQI
jgi:hypothetical protein